MEKKKTNIPLGQGTTSRMNHRSFELPPGLAYDIAKKQKLHKEMMEMCGAPEPGDLGNVVNEFGELEQADCFLERRLNISESVTNHLKTKNNET